MWRPVHEDGAGGRRRGRARARVLGALLGASSCVATLAGCSVLSGFGDFRFGATDGGVESGVTRDAGSDGAPGAPDADDRADADARPADAATADACDERLDCDGDGACETDPRTSRSHCGACGAACGDGEGCFAGECGGVGEVVMGQGGAHACLLDELGRVYCWGRNRYGELGDGTGHDRGAPARVTGLPDTPATRVALGAGTSCAIVEGPVWCWGLGQHGELGSGPPRITLAPEAPVTGLSDAVQLAAGAHHVCALRRDTSVWCWGLNADGQLGDGTTEDRSTPVQVQELRDVVLLTAGANHTCAATADRRVLCWGRSDVGQTGGRQDGPVTQPTLVAGSDGAVALAAGDDHTCLVKTDAKVRCWGSGGLGQLGRGASRPAVGEIGEVTGLTGAASVTAGRDFTCVLLDDGSVECFGAGGEGQLASGTPDVQDLPQAASDLLGVTGVAAGGRSACAWLGSGEVRCWGRNELGSLGRGRRLYQPTPARVGGLASAETLAAGDDHTCASSGGSLVCWGANTNAQLGDGTDRSSSVPRPPSMLAPGATDVVAGAFHTCVTQAGGGAVQCWGANADAQLGVETPSFVLAPSVSPALPGPATALTAGGRHTCARVGEQVWCWGTNEHGQLGVGRVSAHEPPTLTPVSRTPLALDAAELNTCVVSSGVIYCGGDDTFGQLGRGAAGPPATSLLRVETIADATAVAVGLGFACALRETGGVACWGRNEHGQLGLGTTEGPRPSASPVPELAGIAGLTAGTSHACAWDADGAARCWGANESGQLGDGTFDDRVTPTPVLPLPGPVRSVSAGARHTCALLADGTVLCWGAASSGTLGDGSMLRDATPRPIAGSPPGP